MSKVYFLIGQRKKIFLRMLQYKQLCNSDFPLPLNKKPETNNKIKPTKQIPLTNDIDATENPAVIYDPWNELDKFFIKIY